MLRRTQIGSKSRVAIANGGGRSDRRDVILSASRWVLSKKGYEAATVSEIVGRAGVAQGTFYLYFPSKVSLLVALAEKMFVELAVRVTASGASAQTLKDAVEAMIKTGFEVAYEFKDVLRIIGSSGAFAELKQERDRIAGAWKQAFIEFIERWQANGQADADIDAAITGEILAGFVGQSVCHWTANKGALPAHVAEVTRIVHRSLVAPAKE